MNKKIYIFLILILCLLLTGCWNYEEIDSLYIVAGIAIDKVPDTEQYSITTEFINILENKIEKSFESILLEMKGDSTLDAITKMNRISAKRPYWGHMTTLIISEEVAREGIMPFLDLIARNHEGLLSTNIYISKEKPAKKVLETKSFSTDIKSFELEIIVNESKHFVKTDVSIVELATMEDYISTVGREKLQKLTEESLKKRIKSLIKSVQKYFGFDIFEFGNIIRQRNPKLWKTLEEDWDEVFMDANFNVKCDVHIKNSGHTLKPIKEVD